MSQNPNPRVPRITDPANYLNEVLGSQAGSEIPSFYEFLEKFRGVPISTFKESSLEVLALIMETTFYSQYCSILAASKTRNSEEQAEEEQLRQWSENAEASDIDGAIAAMKARTEQLEQLRRSKTAV